MAIIARVPDLNGSPQLRVALLNPCYWPEVRRGAERITRELADGLLARGQLPSLITSHPGLPDRRVEAGVPVVRVPRPPQAPLEALHFESYLTHVPLSYLALRRGSYDLAHAMYPTDALAALRWRRRTGRPAVLTYMGIPARAWLDGARGRREIATRAVRTSDAVVVLSHAAAAALRNSLGRDPRVIHPGVDLAAFRPASRRSDTPTIVCTAAPDIARKNVGLLVRAFTRLRDRIRDARLVLVRPDSLTAAAKAGVDLDAAGVELIDQDHRPAVLSAAYGQAWVSVLPASDEAFGLALVEALACGTPVVGYADGGIPEIVDRSGIGTLFERLDADELARALETGLELAADRATTERCRARAEELSVGHATDAYLALYRELTAH
jgi:glycosyltransferase involved in cell wall biosynthesis